jgi:cobalt/nickel transport protein
MSEKSKVNVRVKQTTYVLTQKKWRWAGLLVGTTVIGALLSRFASSHPDGLDRVAQDHGFGHKAGAVLTWSPFPDYEVGSFASEAIRIGIAGVLGITLVLGVLYATTYLLAGRR